MSIACVCTETWRSTSDDFALRRCTPPGYICADVPRPSQNVAETGQPARRRCVAAIILENGLRWRIITVKLKSKTYESLCFSVLGLKATALVLLLYRPGSTPPLEAFFKELPDYMKVIALYKCQIIVAEDCNIRVEETEDAHAARLADVFHTFGCIQNVSHMPTRREGGTLDLVITKLEQPLDSVSVQPPTVISDHSVIAW